MANFKGITLGQYFTVVEQESQRSPVLLPREGTKLDRKEGGL